MRGFGKHVQSRNHLNAHMYRRNGQKYAASSSGNPARTACASPIADTIESLDSTDELRAWASTAPHFPRPMMLISQLAQVHLRVLPHLQLNMRLLQGPLLRSMRLGCSLYQPSWQSPSLQSLIPGCKPCPHQQLPRLQLPYPLASMSPAQRQRRAVGAAQSQSNFCCATRQAGDRA